MKYKKKLAYQWNTLDFLIIKPRKNLLLNSKANSLILPKSKSKTNYKNNGILKI